MKKLIALALTLCMLLSLAACSCVSAPTAAKYLASEKTDAAAVFTAPGTYSAVEHGRNGDVKLTVEFSADEILSIAVESDETAAIGGAAMTELTETILANQSLAVDAVAGATMSSEAYLAALMSCVEQAGGDMSKLSGDIEAEVIEYVTEADVIVVGAGGAGLTAAVTAANDGASVILLEKSAHVGGNSLCAANGINAFDTDVQLADEAYQNADTSFESFTALQTNELSRPELVEAYIENSTEALNYVASLGVDFTVEIREDSRNTIQNYYLMKAESDGTATMVSIVNALAAAVAASDVELYLNTEVTELVQNEDGAVCGVKALSADGREIEFSAKSVVLCTGGFGKNRELVGEVNPALANAITDELAPTTGDGLVMAQAIGAQAVDLDQIQTFPCVVEGYGMVLPFNLPGGFGLNGSIYVNNSGERFTAEAFEIPEAILSQDDGAVYAIFTEENLNPTLNDLVNLGLAVSADTPEELAEALGISAEGLAATLAQWNEDAASGTDFVFGRTEISPIEGKLYGFRFGVGAHYFMGGLLINEQTQVIDMDGEPIPGLYAAGEVTGGFHGTQRVDGSGTGDSIVFGRIAGHVVAAN